MHVALECPKIPHDLIICLEPMNILNRLLEPAEPVVRIPVLVLESCPFYMID